MLCYCVYTLRTVVIERVGPTPVARTYIERLGRVLVTIDDLQALLDLLKKPDRLLGRPVPKLEVLAVAHDANCSGEHETHGHPQHIEFDGGYFTKPSELPELTDDEARSLRINTPSVQVILSPTRAVAIGDEQAARTIYQSWARSRQTRERPASELRSTHRPNLRFLLSGILLSAFINCVASVVALGIWHSDVSGWELAFEVILLTTFVVGTTGMLAAASVLGYRREESRTDTYAIIYPFNLNEYRRTQASEKYPRRQTILAIWAIVSGLLGAVLGAGVALFIAAYYNAA